MTKIVVQLDAYVIPDDHLIFKVSPGKTYRFYQAVRDARSVFLDVRGLDDLIGEPSEWADKDILSVIAADRWQRELQSRARGNQPHGSEGVGTTDRRNLTFLKRLFFEAKKGDLVVVPVEGYAKDVLIGELLSDAGDVSPVVAKDGEYQHVYFGRPVRWREAKPKRLLSEDLIKALHTQTAIFTLGRSVHEEVYQLAFGNFIYRGRFVSEFATSKNKFTAEDSAVVSTWFNGFDVLRNAIEDGEPGRVEGASFFQLGLTPLPDGKAAELTININSPGEFALRSVTPFALALMAMLPLAACDSKQVVENGVTIELKTIGSASAVNCELEVQETVNAMVQTMSYQRLEEACGLGNRAMTDAKITTGARLKPGGKGGK